MLFLGQCSAYLFFKKNAEQFFWDSARLYVLKNSEPFSVPVQCLPVSKNAERFFSDNAVSICFKKCRTLFLRECSSYLLKKTLNAFYQTVQRLHVLKTVELSSRISSF
jgi:hypothetical protein